MTGLYTADMLQLLRFDRKGKLIKKGNYRFAIICAVLIDLVNLKLIDFKRQDEDRLIVKAIDNRVTNNLLLDELFLTIRDCPKVYTLDQWFDRFLDCFDAYEEIHLESLIQREIIVEKRKSEFFFKYMLFCLLLLIVPFLSIPLFSYMLSLSILIPLKKYSLLFFFCLF